MTASAEKLETAILAILHDHPEGKHEANMTGHFGWIELVAEHLGKSADYYAEIEAALKCFHNDGIVRLTQYDLDRKVRYEYQDGVTDDGVFFGRWKFQVAITAKGRAFWKVPRSSNMGFKKPA